MRAADAPAAIEADSRDLPEPLVRFATHPVRWMRIKAELTLDAVVLAHVGVLIVAALYYLLTQTNAGVKHWWDTSVTPATLRHDIRDVGEGVLASCLAQGVVWNPFTKGHRNTGRVFRSWRERYHIPVVPTAILAAAVVGAVAFAIGDVALHLLSVHVHAVRPRGSIWSRTATLWQSGWDKKALGFVAALVARRPLHVVYDEVQEYFAGRRAAARRPLRPYHPPVFQARYNYIAAGRGTAKEYPLLLRWFMGLLVLVSIGLAGFGYYVLTYKA